VCERFDVVQDFAMDTLASASSDELDQFRCASRTPAPPSRSDSDERHVMRDCVRALLICLCVHHSDVDATRARRSRSRSRSRERPRARHAHTSAANLLDDATAGDATSVNARSRHRHRRRRDGNDDDKPIASTTSKADDDIGLYEMANDTRDVSTIADADEHTWLARTRTLLRPGRYASTFVVQLGALAQRALRQTVRSWRLLLTHASVAVLLAILVGRIYWQRPLDLGGFQDRLGAMFFSLALFAFANLSVLDIFVVERVRECGRVCVRARETCAAH
jgi:hypothetical protein